MDVFEYYVSDQRYRIDDIKKAIKQRKNSED